jgi:hypothetical protein
MTVYSSKKTYNQNQTFQCLYFYVSKNSSNCMLIFKLSKVFSIKKNSNKTDNNINSKRLIISLFF